MTDFSPSIYASGVTQYQPPNALQQLSTLANTKNALVQNQIAQQTLQQQQMQTQIMQGQLDANDIIANTPRLPDGRYDTNAMKMAGALKPNSLPFINDFALKQYGNPVEGGVDMATGTKQLTTPGALTAQQEQPNAGTIAAELPPDPLNQRQWLQTKLAAGSSATQDKAALLNIWKNLQAPNAAQGTLLADWKIWLAQRGINVADSADAATTLQTTKDHAAQLNVAGGGSTDLARMNTELANVNTNDLTGSLKRMVPYLIGTRDMAADQMQILHQSVPNGVDPTAIGNVRSKLAPLSDPRSYELQFLKQQTDDPTAYKTRLGNLSSADRDSLIAVRNGLATLKSDPKAAAQ